MDAKEKVLATMKEAGQPLNAGKISELSGLDRKEVDAAMEKLKLIVFDPIHHGYIELGKTIGKAFSDGKALK